MRSDAGTCLLQGPDDLSHHLVQIDNDIAVHAAWQKMPWDRQDVSCIEGDGDRYTSIIVME